MPHLWTDDALQKLLAERRGAANPGDRAAASKRIRQLLRQHLRDKRNKRTIDLLEGFKNLSELDMLRHDPVRGKRQSVSSAPSPAEFATYLAGIFRSEQRVAAPHCSFQGIPVFSSHELHASLETMKANRDNEGLVLEMFKFESVELHDTWLDIYNYMCRKVVTARMSTTGGR